MTKLSVTAATPAGGHVHATDPTHAVPGTSGPRRPVSRRLRTAGIVALALATALPVASLAQATTTATHRTYRQTADAYSPRFDSPIAPGVDLAGYTSAAGGHQANSDVMTVDLTHPGVSAGVLSSRVTDTEPVQGWAQRFGAVAAVNGDYFDIGASQAPIGSVVRDGVLRKGTRSGQSMTGEGTDGELRTSTVYLDGTVKWGKGVTHPLDLYNTDLAAPTAMPKNGLAVLDGEWGASPLTFTNAPKKLGVVVVGSNHKVISASAKLTHQTVPSHGMLLIGTGSYASLAKLAKGTVVSDTIAMHTDAAYPFSWGLGAGLPLMRNGSVIHNYRDDTDPHDARTALGWRDNGRTMIVITVEYGGGSIGEGVNEIADELAAEGATDGVLLDGGGSTTLVARGQGDPTTGQVGPVSTAGGVQRHVPIGIGVFVPHGSGLVDGFDTQLDAGTVFPGLHRQLSYHAWDEWYGPATLDPGSATVTTDNAGLLREDAVGRVLALRPGAGHVIATAPTTAPGSPGTATSGVYLKVLQPLAQLDTPGSIRLTPNKAMSYTLSGSDSAGEVAPILASDVTAAYNSAVLSVTPAADGSLTIVSHAPEGVVTPLTLSVGGVTSTIAIRVGFGTVQVLNPAAKGSLLVANGKGAIVPLARGVAGLKVSPGKTTASAVAHPSVALPVGTGRLGVTVYGDGQRHAVGALVVDAAGHQHKINLGTDTGKGSKRLEAAVPAGSKLIGISVGRGSAKKPGFVTITQVVART